MDKQAEGQELLEGLTSEVATAYQTERPMLLEQLQKQTTPNTALNLVQNVVRGTAYEYLKMLQDTKMAEYRALLQAFGCANEDEFAAKASDSDLLKSNGFDVTAEAQALVQEKANS